MSIRSFMLMVSIHQVSEFSGKPLYRVFGEQQQQVEMNVVAFHAVADLHGQGFLPALLIDTNQLIDAAPRAQYLRVTLGERNVDLLGDPAQAGADQDSR